MRGGWTLRAVLVAAIAAAPGCSALTSFDDLVGADCVGSCTDGSILEPPIDATPADGRADAPPDARVDAPVDAPVDSPRDSTASDGPGAESGGGDSGSDATVAPPITFVQSTTGKPTTATSTINIPAPVGAHDAIIVAVMFNSGPTLVAVGDSQNNNYTIVFGPHVGTNDNHYIAVALDVAGGSDSIALVYSAAPGGSDVFVAEYSGLALTNAFDVSSVADGTTTGTDAMNSGSATTTFANELIFGFADSENASAGTGFTARANRSGNIIEDQVVSSAGSYQATASSANGPWTMIMATFNGQ